MSFKRDTHVIYHKGCNDGFGAAWTAHKALGDERVYYHARAYGDDPPEMASGSLVYILDFSFPRDTMKQMVVDHEVVLLDHHKSAEADIGDMPGCHFDMNHSGAYLTWRWFHHDIMTDSVIAPALIMYIEDRDLWKWELPESREISAGLSSFPLDFDVWDSLYVEGLAHQGSTILRNQRKQVERLADMSFFCSMAGWVVPIVNTPLLASEVCEALLEKFPYDRAPFSAVYYDADDGKRHWSLRSRGDFDVSEIAQQYGGGGHRAAAGCTEPSGTPVYRVINP